MFFFSLVHLSPDHGPKKCAKKKVFGRLPCMDGCCRLPHRTEKKKKSHFYHHLNTPRHPSRGNLFFQNIHEANNRFLFFFEFPFFLNFSPLLHPPDGSDKLQLVACLWKESHPVVPFLVYCKFDNHQSSWLPQRIPLLRFVSILLFYDF